MRKLKDINCMYCKESFQPTGPAQKMCSVCKKHVDNVTAQCKRDVIRFNKFGTYDTIGRGQTVPSGKDSVLYKTGRGFFHKVLAPAVKTRRYCERCYKDLINASRYEWCAHHKDHDQHRNEIDNIELLCKRCHQLEHNCQDNLPV